MKAKLKTTLKAALFFTLVGPPLGGLAVFGFTTLASLESWKLEYLPALPALASLMAIVAYIPGSAPAFLAGAMFPHLFEIVSATGFSGGREWSKWIGAATGAMSGVLSAAVALGVGTLLPSLTDLSMALMLAPSIPAGLVCGMLFLVFWNPSEKTNRASNDLMQRLISENNTR